MLRLMVYSRKKARIASILALTALLGLSAHACVGSGGGTGTDSAVGPGTDSETQTAAGDTSVDTISSASVDTVSSASETEDEDPFYTDPGPLPQSARPCRQPVLVKGVLEVIDGDTFWVDMESGPHEKVRLLGVDTPEVAHDGAPAECFAKNSTEYTKSKLTKDRFWMSFDDECEDHYGRTLAYITTREGFFQPEQLESGFAVVMTVKPNDTYRDDFEEAEQRARASGAGLWGACDF